MESQQPGEPKPTDSATGQSASPPARSTKRRWMTVGITFLAVILAVVATATWINRPPAPMEHGLEINSVVFSPDGDILATAGWDDTARVWDPATGEEITAFDHRNLVHSVAFSPGGKLLATASEDRTARMWDPATGEEVTAAE